MEDEDWCRRSIYDNYGAFFLLIMGFIIISVNSFIML